MPTKAIRVRDLQQRTSVEERNGALFIVPQPFLYCATCGGRYSANAGDYFAARPDAKLTCCRRNMHLVREQCTLEEV